MNISYQHLITVNLHISNTSINSKVSIIKTNPQLTLLNIESVIDFTQLSHLPHLAGNSVKNSATILLGNKQRFRYEFKTLLISTIRMIGIQTDPALN